MQFNTQHCERKISSRDVRDEETKQRNILNLNNPLNSVTNK